MRTIRKRKENNNKEKEKKIKKLKPIIRHILAPNSYKEYADRNTNVTVMIFTYFCPFAQLRMITEDLHGWLGIRIVCWLET